MTDGLGHLGQKKAKMNEVRTGQKNKKGCQEVQKNALFAPAVLLSIKIKKKE